MIETVRQTGRPILLSCDPVHGTTAVTTKGHSGRVVRPKSARHATRRPVACSRADWRWSWGRRRRARA
ncbi:MAG: hypothetical protein EOM22_11550 [Gammaproteobacteria bacterium]|nr:hypothetical protein [Gammaproteobacteria bacterium]